MSASVGYVLDTNVFIQAKRRYYAFDLCPGFWESLIAYHKSGRLRSIEQVRMELNDVNDEITRWVTKQMPKSCFVPTDDSKVVNEYDRIIAWAKAQPQYFELAISEFSAKADAWLIAYAKIHGLIVVTLEEYSKDARRKVLIPNVCEAFNVEYVDTFKMLRDLGISFHWNPSA